MTSILLAACLLVCPLVMGVMMFGMRRGAPPRKQRRRRVDSGPSRIKTPDAE